MSWRGKELRANIESENVRGVTPFAFCSKSFKQVSLLFGQDGPILVSEPRARACVLHFVLE